MPQPGAWSLGVAVLLAAAVVSCGGGSPSSAPTPTPTPPPGGGGTGGGGTGGGGAPMAATITITGNGVSPREVTVAQGGRVTFVNNNSRGHDMSSDPHPEHSDCPDVNVGFIQPGQSRTTLNLNTVRSCGFHDHNQPSVANLRGTIRIQ